MVKVTNATKTYHPIGEIVQAVDDISFFVDEGDLISITGESGSGKTTLLRLLAGLETLTSGSIEINDTVINELSREKMTVFRRKYIGLVFQDYNLLPALSVYDNIVLPMALGGEPFDRDFFRDIIDMLGIESKLRFKPAQLSGGEQQRVALARALIAKPALLLADEPTGNLDTRNSGIIVKILQDMNLQYHQTVILVTHNMEIAHATNRVITMGDGRIKSDTASTEGKYLTKDESLKKCLPPIRPS